MLRLVTTFSTVVRGSANALMAKSERSARDDMMEILWRAVDCGGCWDVVCVDKLGIGIRCFVFA